MLDFLHDKRTTKAHTCVECFADIYADRTNVIRGGDTINVSPNRQLKTRSFQT